ncbi:hypothetical protein [Paraburkholderia sp. CNPSo 3281]|uniref:hypothetical protein n=1 Tax=Paraburkholderia sp. CNPSo 3281 TaxID=2940933 RepID=UPI0020B7D160|nr:hypothetical protein [Paraburkholderia sp. CNPSo 3281]MCP3715823.1 hypothetical protein [Paraburkholderia sp. CNPSo 3281]
MLRDFAHLRDGGVDLLDAALLLLLGGGSDAACSSVRAERSIMPAEISRVATETDSLPERNAVEHETCARDGNYRISLIRRR